MRYYIYERYVDSTDNPNAFSGKYLRFVDDPTIVDPSNIPASTATTGYTATKPDVFVLPNHPYAEESSGVISFIDWVYNKDTQNLFTVKSGNEVVVKENSVYTFANSIPNLTIKFDGEFFKESSVFFTFDNSASHTVTFKEGKTNINSNKVIGSQQYWESGKSYIITVYNGYYIIGVVRAN